MASCRAEVLGGDDRLVQVRRTGACSGCGGCGGRCNLFLGDDAATLQLPLGAFASPPVPGTAVLLDLPDDWLARSAWRGYGLPLAGMVTGAAAGHGLGLLLGIAPDLPALGMALAGTFALFRFSKAAEPHIAVRAID